MGTGITKMFRAFQTIKLQEKTFLFVDNEL